jgi:hypothetical protein
VLPTVPERQPESITPLERTGKSGGNNTFYYIKKSAATTLLNALFIVVSAVRVVAVAALLQNSERGRKVQLKNKT